MSKSNISGYDVTQDPTAPNLLFHPSGGAGDGGVFVPEVTAVEGGYQISWTNNIGLDNPDPVTVLNGTDGANGTNGTNGVDGSTFTPAVTPVTNGYQISWSNDGGLQNPPTITISNGINGVNGENGEDGLTYTPVMTPTADGTQLSWINNGTAENPQPVVILNGSDGEDGAKGVTFKPTLTPVTWTDLNYGSMSGYILSWSNDGGLVNPSDVRVANGRDGKIGATGPQGTTFTPIITPVTNGYQISWSNDGGLTNPEPVTISNGQIGATGNDGATFTPAITEVTGGYQLSWTNNGGYQNPQTITILNGVPAGGSGGQVLGKASSADGDLSWLNQYFASSYRNYLFAMPSGSSYYGYLGEVRTYGNGPNQAVTPASALGSTTFSVTPWDGTSDSLSVTVPAFITSVFNSDSSDNERSGQVVTLSYTVRNAMGLQRVPVFGLANPRYVPLATNIDPGLSLVSDGGSATAYHWGKPDYKGCKYITTLKNNNVYDIWNDIDIDLTTSNRVMILVSTPIGDVALQYIINAGYIDEYAPQSANRIVTQSDQSTRTTTISVLPSSVTSASPVVSDGFAIDVTTVFNSQTYQYTGMELSLSSFTPGSYLPLLPKTADIYLYKGE